MLIPQKQKSCFKSHLEYRTSNIKLTLGTYLYFRASLWSRFFFVNKIKIVDLLSLESCFKMQRVNCGAIQSLKTTLKMGTGIR